MSIPDLPHRAGTPADLMDRIIADPDGLSLLTTAEKFAFEAGRDERDFVRRMHALGGFVVGVIFTALVIVIWRGGLS
jgi:hypothetical protein